MAQMVESPMTFTAGEALAIYRRVKLSSGSGTEVEYADAGDFSIGVTQEAAASAGLVSVKDVKDGGSQVCVASGAITVGATIYAADDGKVSASVTGMAIGYALEAALADGDQIECYLNDSIGEAWS
jgi:hypothetical protein